MPKYFGHSYYGRDKRITCRRMRAGLEFLTGGSHTRTGSFGVLQVMRQQDFKPCKGRNQLVSFRFYGKQRLVFSKLKRQNLLKPPSDNFYTYIFLIQADAQLLHVSPTFTHGTCSLLCRTWGLPYSFFHLREKNERQGLQSIQSLKRKKRQSMDPWPGLTIKLLLGICKV